MSREVQILCLGPNLLGPEKPAWRGPSASSLSHRAHLAFGASGALISQQQRHHAVLQGMGKAQPPSHNHLFVGVWPGVRVKDKEGSQIDSGP